MSFAPRLAFWIAAVFSMGLSPRMHAADGPLQLHLRGRTNDTAREETATWNPKKTALIICDMWDDHWCKSAAKRVGELAGPMDEMIKTARKQGVFIIHAPSTCTGFYKDTPQRKLALDAPFAKTPVPLATKERWGTAWCWPDE